MTRVLITGGTGTLGREVVRRLADAGYTLRVMSRRSRSASPWPDVEWVQADLATGAGLREAVTGVQFIVHAATHSTVVTPHGLRLRGLLYQPPTMDVNGTRRLLAHARAGPQPHVLYLSIVGIDRVPRAYYPYFQHKLDAERLVMQAGLPWAILRATQFYILVDSFFQKVMRWPLVLLPSDLLGQPIAPSDVAERVRDTLCAGETGRLPDIGGPEVLTLGQLARTWLAVRGMQRRLVHLRLPGQFAAAVRQGALTCPEQRSGGVSWADW
ncbi:MAG TPA: SDR family oxidoreductase, partial [Roseiflexaceae bacterium]